MNKFNHLINQNFSLAASKYLQYANIQKEAAAKIIHYLPQYYTSGTVLDLGSGPGTFKHIPGWNLPSIAVDLSTNMLKTSQNDCAIAACAENLPVKSASINLIISNLMLQWPQNKALAFAEIKRVLQTEGIIIFTTLIQPSLGELRQAWHQVDADSHTLDFLTATDYLNLCNTAGLNIIQSEAWQTTLYFNDIYQLMAHFKNTGTSLPKSESNSGLGGRRALQQLVNNYPAEPQGLPLTYHFNLLIASKNKGNSICHK